MHEHLETPGRNLFQIYHSLFYTTSNFPQLLFTDFTDLILVSLRFEKQLVQRPCRTSCGRTTLRLVMFGEPIRKQNISWSDLVHLFSQGWRRPQHTHTRTRYYGFNGCTCYIRKYIPMIVLIFHPSSPIIPFARNHLCWFIQEGPPKRLVSIGFRHIAFMVDMMYWTSWMGKLCILILSPSIIFTHVLWWYSTRKHGFQNIVFPVDFCVQLLWWYILY